MIANTATEKPARQKYSVDLIKVRAMDRVDGILIDVAHLPPEIVQDKTTREHPCPKCGGTTRFRVFNDGKGGAYCNICFNQKNGDFLSTVGWSLDVDFNEACRLCAEYLGVEPLGKTVPVDTLTAVCNVRNIPSVESFKAYGAREDKRGRATVARIDCYDEKGQVCSYYDFMRNGEKFAKKREFEGEVVTGIFLPGRKPVPGETWYITEGASDAATLHSLGYTSTLGSYNKKFDKKYHGLLSGCDVVLVPDVDLDGGGLECFKKAARELASVARSVKVAHLPIEEGQKGDVRDVLREKVRRPSTMRSLTRE